MSSVIVSKECKHCNQEITPSSLENYQTRILFYNNLHETCFQEITQQNLEHIKPGLFLNTLETDSEGSYGVGFMVLNPTPEDKLENPEIETFEVLKYNTSTRHKWKGGDPYEILSLEKEEIIFHVLTNQPNINPTPATLPKEIYTDILKELMTTRNECFQSIIEDEHNNILNIALGLVYDTVEIDFQYYTEVAETIRVFTELRFTNETFNF